METQRTGTESNKVSFRKQLNGYDIAQVDAYIESITDAYQEAYDEYNVLCEEYDKLSEDLKVFQEREQGRISVEAISNTMLKAEEVSKKIIADARAEAEKIKKSAYMDIAAVKVQVQKLLDAATAEAAQIKETAQVILDGAHAEATMLIDNAQSMIDNARVETARIGVRANNNAKQANMKITHTASQMKPLLLPRVLDAHPGHKPGVLHLNKTGDGSLSYQD